MTKKRILDVATEEFATLGYSGLSMNKLAEKLKINKAMIYYYFKDKRNLYDEVISSIIELNEEEKKEILNSSLEAKEKFKRYIKLYTKTINNNPNIIPLTLREMANFDLGIENNIPNSIEQELVLMKQIILQLNLKEKYKDIDFYELKAMIIGTISSYYSMQKTPLKLSNIKDFDKNDTKILNYVEEFITNILLDALCEN
ncbi:TetR/AcrR family transcriptional regulator [Aliarcobacter cryaerophilus]|jgi:AcrR family transcriptional regulator|uniref:TetR/AcrR family transcriptional regulator n=1 Tax=Aliarcobacter cryaerophilus TaxID=28198 RepID=UPI0021B555A7|nr:TetR/AcrR family transcriptional regulator [Aliarcobacter cryaerophilus]MCT7500200.1 TetR/AcrR family transcriptional regulator [Aliarcobacter cryaerophilus]